MNTARQHQDNVTKRIRDLVLEIAVAIVLVAGFVAYLFTLPAGTKLDLRPFAAAANTAIVFGFVLWWFRESWRSFTFWGAMLALLAVHACVYDLVLRRVSQIPGAYYVLLDGLEWIVMLRFLSWVRSRNEAHHKD